MCGAEELEAQGYDFKAVSGSDALAFAAARARTKILAKEEETRTSSEPS